MAESDPQKEIDEPYELPEGWLWTTLGEICSKPQYGWTASADPNGEGLKLLRTTDISPGNISWPTVPACSKLPDDLDKYKLKPGDIVVSRAGSVGISIELTESPNAIFASYLIRFNAMSPIPPRYISLFLKTPYYWSSIQDNTAGIAIPNVNATKLANLKIPLSPLPEQHRIVTKLETLLAQVSRSKDHLAKVPPLIKRFRQSVLAAACSGRLTEDWRREHLNVEHASELLNRIREERIRRYEEECRKAEAEGRRKPKKPKNIEPQKVDAKGLPELPEGWVWTKLESACSDIVDCPHSTPKFQTDGKYCIDTTCINGGKIDFKKIRYVSEKTYQERIKRLKPRLNDVIFSREGTIGNAVLLLDLDFCMGQRVMLFRSNSSVVPNYLVRYLNSQLLKDQYVHLTIGSTSPHINVGDIKNMLTPLPSLAEQRVIVEQVETLFHFADEVEQRVAAATTHTNHLTQSILARAFRGELVPQDLNDEPASVLLERIKQARAELKEKKKTQKRKSKTLLDFN